MRTCSVGMMAITFLLGGGSNLVIVYPRKMLVDMAQDAYRKQHEGLLVLAEN